MGIKAIFNKFQEWSKRGMYWPFAHDPVSNQPSITLMFFYIAFIGATCFISASSTMLIIKGDYLAATVMPTFLLFLGFIFYRLRRLDKIKIDFDDKQIELSAKDNE